MNDALIEALDKRERDYKDAANRLHRATYVEVDSTRQIDEDHDTIREAIALVRVLRLLIERDPRGFTAADLRRAFGAPGDFGYDTPIGDALAKVYRGNR